MPGSTDIARWPTWPPLDSGGVSPLYHKPQGWRRIEDQHPGVSTNPNPLAPRGRVVPCPILRRGILLLSGFLPCIISHGDEDHHTQCSRLKYPTPYRNHPRIVLLSFRSILSRWVLLRVQSAVPRYPRLEEYTYWLYSLEHLPTPNNMRQSFFLTRLDLYPNSGPRWNPIVAPGQSRQPPGRQRGRTQACTRQPFGDKFRSWDMDRNCPDRWSHYHHP